MGLETAPRLPSAKLEPVVFDTLQKQIDTCIEIDALIDDVVKSEIITSKCRKRRDELTKHQRDCKKADDMLASAYTHHLAGLIDSKEFGLVRAKFERDKQSSELRVARIQTELANFDLKKQRDNEFTANIHNLKGFTKLDKALISTLITRIEVTPLTNEIDIVLNYMDEIAELNSLIEESGVFADVCG